MRSLKSEEQALECGFGTSGAGVADTLQRDGNRDFAAADAFEEEALEGSAAFRAMRIDRAARAFQCAAGLDEEIVVFDFEAECFEGRGFARAGEFDVGEEGTIAAQAAARAEQRFEFAGRVNFGGQLGQISDMISFIVPAHNEEALIVRTIEAIHSSAKATGEDYEIVVVNDASTDRTAELARENGALVVSVGHRQIARTRNSGGHAARGDRFFFIDADTLANPAAVKAALRVMDKGAVGGGALVKIEPPSPLYIRLIVLASLVPAKLAGFCGGAFMFCTRDAFLKSGGFDERMFWAEEGAFALRLKRLGAFTVVWPRVFTSGRRLHTLSARKGVSFARGLLRGSKAFTSRESVKEIWYDSNRAEDQTPAVSVGRRIANGILLFITLALISGPMWSFIPWSLTPLSTPFGKFRFVVAMIICHAGLVFWPFGIALLVNLFRQTWSREWIRLAAVAAFCLWMARDCSIGVMKLWMIIYAWLTTG